MAKMTKADEVLWDAHADHEAWSLAHDILEPLVEAIRPAGSDELTRVLEKALEEVGAEVGRTLDVLEGLGEAEAYRQARRSTREAEILSEANANLSAAVDVLEKLPEEGAADAEKVRRAVQSICEGGYIVASEQRRVAGEAGEDADAGA
jgi:hypothetical protein